MLKTMIGLGLIFLSLSAMSGQERGGGDAIYKDGNWSLLDLSEEYDTQYFSPQTEPFFATNFAVPYLVALNKCSYPFYYVMKQQMGFNESLRQTTFQAGSKIFQIPNEHVGQNILNNRFANSVQTFDRFESVNTLKVKFRETIWLMTDKDLEKIPDEGTIKIGAGDLQNGLVEKQLAVQRGDIVLINRPLFLQLDERNKAALIFHEISLYAALGGNPGLIHQIGTVPVRNFVHLLFAESQTTAIPDGVFEDFCGWQGKFFSALRYQVKKADMWYDGPGGHIYSLSISR